MKVTLFTLLGFLSLLTLLGLALPPQYSVERKIVISSAPSKVFEQINDLRNWDNWMPWAGTDPELLITPGERSEGVGATQSWVGKDGVGSLRVFTSRANELFEYEILFGGETIRSSSGSARSSIRLHAMPSGTEVVWTMKGKMNIPVVNGYFAVYMNRLAGGMLQKGLQNLKSLVETANESVSQ